MKMDNLTKQRITNHLSYCYYLYLIVAILITLGWYEAFSLYYRLKSNEKVSIYIISNVVDTTKLDINLSKRLLNGKLKEIIVNSDSITNPNLYLLLNTKGLVNTDIIILPASIANNVNLLYEFALLDKDYLANFIDDGVNYLQVNNLDIGLLIYDNQVGILDDYITYSEEKYYLFLNKKSVNIGNLNNSKSDIALNVLTILFEVDEPL
jgi:hypothetical protein